MFGCSLNFQCKAKWTAPAYGRALRIRYWTCAGNEFKKKNLTFEVRSEQRGVRHLLAGFRIITEKKTGYKHNKKAIAFKLPPPVACGATLKSARTSNGKAGGWGTGASGQGETSAVQRPPAFLTAVSIIFKWLAKK